jgi:hypothetical protein
VKGLFRLLLAIWTIAFLVVSCAPLLTGNLIFGGAGLLAGAVLFIPWLVGAIGLSILIWLTNRRG